MLRAEDGFERHARGLSQDVNGAASLGVESGLVGESPFFFCLGGGERSEVLVLEHIDPILTVPLRTAIRRAAVWGSLYPVMLFKRTSCFSSRSMEGPQQPQSRLSSESHHASLASGMDGVGQEDDVGPGGGSIQSDVPMKPVCPKEPTGKKSPRLLENGESMPTLSLAESAR